MRYNSRPDILQAAIRAVFNYATATINLSDCCEEMVPLALFEALNGKDSRDYIARVEPSERGGRKIAESILRAAKILGGGDGNGTTSTQEQLQGGVVGSAVVPGAPAQASM